AVGKYTNHPVELDLVRHVILNSIRAVNSKFRGEYGDLVIAVDSAASWRKDFFPYYKAHRSDARKASDINWSDLYNCMNIVKNELQENFPYKVVKGEKAEADDIIAVLARLCVKNQEKC